MKTEELVVKIDEEEELEEESNRSSRRRVPPAAEDSNALHVDIGDGEEEEPSGANNETERTNKKVKRSVNLRSLIAKFQAPPATGSNAGGDADPYSWFESKDVQQQQHKAGLAKKTSKRH
ncbi:hypothetical protein GNI_044840 [Gregarina niphandrodes]|uniref:Uncharacterized protein n=1 Tax=Gregarina niphandrodes TaxID=110365 RepID=A0A023B9X7_GRENI|nr:hypothetical protein GNI_044840 [Gregarina niphandrodes]EZG76511.1 hypothetical protein GNI_044840 [Gregarina niphandrodes]|eukprot:XP_011129571.1 hypothetical protein GNI_044840 [Gregarina niphandrodes]